MVKKKFQYYEVVLIGLVWVLLIASPVFFSEKESFEWSDLMGPLLTIVPLFFIFIINRFVLVPRFLYQKKTHLLFNFSFSFGCCFFYCNIFVYGQHERKEGQSRNLVINGGPRRPLIILIGHPLFLKRTEDLFLLLQTW